MERDVVDIALQSVLSAQNVVGVCGVASMRVVKIVLVVQKNLNATLGAKAAIKRVHLVYLGKLA